MWLAFLPVMVLLQTAFPHPKFNPFFVYVPFWLLAIIYLWLFRCPACNRLFMQTWRWGNPFARKCLHCGTRKGSAPDAAAKN